MCSTVCLDQMLQKVEHVTVRLYRHELILFVIIIIHVIFSFSLKNVLFFISFVMHHFYFYIIFVLKINIVFVSLNDGQNISVAVIVTVTEISLESGIGAGY